VQGQTFQGVAFSPDGRSLAIGASGILGPDAIDGEVILWDVRGGRTSAVLKRHADVVRAVAFSPDGRRLASSSYDEAVKIWDLEGLEVLSLGTHLSGSFLAFSPDGRWLATEGRTGIQLWDARPDSPELRVEREAFDLVEFLFDRPLLKPEVLDRIRVDQTITETVRRKALELTALYRDDPSRVNATSWAVVGWPGRTAEAYRMALSAMEAVRRMGPDDVDILVTLAAAHYRLGQYRQGVSFLIRAAERKEGHPACLAFLAMAQHRLGQTTASQVTLARLRKAAETMSIEDDESRALMREAEDTLRAPAPASRE
jgi:hypothetical protein